MKTSEIFKKQLKNIFEFLVFFVIIILLDFFSILNPLATILAISSALFIWSARYGLFSFLISLSLFQLVSTFYSSKRIDITTVKISADLASELISLYVIIVGLLLGIIGELLNKKINTLTNEQEKLKLQNNELLNHIDKLNTLINQLQARVYFEGEGLIVLLERLKELEILDLDEILTRSVEIIANFFELDNFHFYRVNNGFMRFVAGIGSKKLPNSLNVSNSKVISRAIEKGYATFPEIIFESDVEHFEPWFAISVGNREDVLGVFVVEEIDISKISETLVQYLNSVVSWLYSNIKIIQEQEKLFVERYRNPDNTWKEEYYESRKKVLEKRKELFGIPYEEICLTYKMEYHNSIFKLFRNSDIINSKLYNNGYVITQVLLPVCDLKGKLKVLERIKEKFDVLECEKMLKCSNYKEGSQYESEVSAS